MRTSIDSRVISTRGRVIGRLSSGSFAARALRNTETAIREAIWNTRRIPLPIVTGEHHPKRIVIVIVGGT
jgi:hypothetical protein